MSTITLLTDFGTRDGYVGAMKGVLRRLAPQAQIIDISHDIPPQDIHQAAFVLRSILPYFPEDTIHVVVVDPGVGSERRPVAVIGEQASFVGPDNGVFTPVYESQPAAEIFELRNPAYHLPEVSATFHGRDIFAPVAAHLANGVAPEMLGPRVDDPVRLLLPQALRLADGSLQGTLQAVDHFGNCISNIPGAVGEELCSRARRQAGTGGG